MNVVASGAGGGTGGGGASSTSADIDAVDASTPPAPVPRPRRFPCVGDAPGPRCGHTLTAITGPDGNLASARLVLFGTRGRRERRRREEGAIEFFFAVGIILSFPGAPLFAQAATTNLMCHRQYAIETLSESHEELKGETKHEKAYLMLLRCCCCCRRRKGPPSKKKIGGKNASSATGRSKPSSQPQRSQNKKTKITGGATALEGTARGDGAPPASPGPSPAAVAAGSGKEMVLLFSNKRGLSFSSLFFRPPPTPPPNQQQQKKHRNPPRRSHLRRPHPRRPVREVAEGHALRRAPFPSRSARRRSRRLDGRRPGRDRPRWARIRGPARSGFHRARPPTLA